MYCFAEILETRRVKKIRKNSSDKIPVYLDIRRGTCLQTSK